MIEFIINGLVITVAVVIIGGSVAYSAYLRAYKWAEKKVRDDLGEDFRR